MNPIQIIADSRTDAFDQNDPMARFGTFTTVDEEGFPRSRTITIRGLSPDEDAGYFEFSISTTSPKYANLQATSSVASGGGKKCCCCELHILYPVLMVQFRIRGDVTYLTRDNDQVQQKWKAKPETSQIADLLQTPAFPQSSVIQNRQQLLDAAQRIQPPLAMPDTIVTTRLTPNYIETWKGSLEDRIHHRHLYTRSPVDRKWTSAVLVP